MQSAKRKGIRLAFYVQRYRVGDYAGGIRIRDFGSSTSSLHGPPDIGDGNRAPSPTTANEMPLLPMLTPAATIGREGTTEWAANTVQHRRKWRDRHLSKAKDPSFRCEILLPYPVLGIGSYLRLPGFISRWKPQLACWRLRSPFQKYISIYLSFCGNCTRF